jgi:hypothetical protein
MSTSFYKYKMDSKIFTNLALRTPAFRGNKFNFKKKLPNYKKSVGFEVLTPGDMDSVAFWAIASYSLCVNR